MRKTSCNSRADARIPVLVVGASAKNGPAWLDGYGFSATPCSDARDMLKMLGQRRHQAVLCDIEMSGIGVKALLKAVNAQFPDVAVVAVTRPSALRHGVLAMIAGAAGYVQTPLQPENVVASLRSALNSKRLDSAVRGSSFQASN